MSDPTADGPTGVRLGWWLSSEEHDPRDLVEHAVAAERIGVTTAMISDHLQHAGAESLERLCARVFFADLRQIRGRSPLRLELPEGIREASPACRRAKSRASATAVS